MNWGLQIKSTAKTEVANLKHFQKMTEMTYVLRFGIS